MNLEQVIRAIRKSEGKILAFPNLRPSVRLKLYRIFNHAYTQALYYCN